MQKNSHMTIFISKFDFSIDETLINDFNEIEKLFIQVIKKGQSSGEISEKNDC